MSAEEPEPYIVEWPSDEETRSAFEAYTLAVGKVAHAWNYLHERLARLFCVVVRAEDPAISLAIWYSTTNERTQRDMLKAAFDASNAERWKPFPAAADDFDWLLDKLNTLAGIRNNAIHAPCSLYIGGGDAGSLEMGASFFQGHPRAKELQGRRILTELAWCEDYAENLTRFVAKLESAIASTAGYPWPSRPPLPSRPSKP